MSASEYIWEWVYLTLSIAAPQHIGHWTYRTLNISDFEHIGYWTYRTLNISDIEHIGHWTYLTFNISDIEYIWQCIYLTMDISDNIYIYLTLNMPITVHRRHWAHREWTIFHLSTANNKHTSQWTYMSLNQPTLNTSQLSQSNDIQNTVTTWKLSLYINLKCCEKIEFDKVI